MPRNIAYHKGVGITNESYNIFADNENYFVAKYNDVMSNVIVLCNYYWLNIEIYLQVMK